MENKVDTAIASVVTLSLLGNALVGVNYWDANRKAAKINEIFDQANIPQNQRPMIEHIIFGEQGNCTLVVNAEFCERAKQALQPVYEDGELVRTIAGPI